MAAPHIPSPYGDTTWGSDYYGDIDGTNLDDTGIPNPYPGFPYGTGGWAQQFFAEIGNNTINKIVDNDDRIMILRMTTQIRNLFEEFRIRPVTIAEYGDPFP